MPSIITIDNHANILSSIGKTVDLHKRKSLTIVFRSSHEQGTH